MTGTPLANAIVWQDTRTAAICAELAGDHGIDRFRDTTGLPLATYFSGPKASWLLANVEELAAKAERGEALMGTMDSWVAWNLTGGPNGGRHVTDVSNASRTLLMDLDAMTWSASLLAEMGIPSSMMAEIVPSIGRIGTATVILDGVPISCVLGDQHAALFGQACFEPGEAKNTYGTGCFMLMNTGTDKVPSTSGLLTTVGYQVAGEPVSTPSKGRLRLLGRSCSGCETTWESSATRLRSKRWRHRWGTTATCISSPPSPGCSHRIGGPMPEA